ncbi:MAG: winged helix-turn-helix domain-containing protein [Pseudomonadota bacterium]
MKQVRIGNTRVNFSSLVIEGDAGRFSVEPKVLDVLQALIDNHGEVVSRDELIDKVWGIGHGGDERLSRAISLLRKAFGDQRGNHRHIETISKRGYRLVAPVNGKERQIGGGAVFDPPAQSIAVLPFVNMSAERDHEHFADGMTEELMNALTHVPQLKVIGRTSAFAFKGQNKDVREIGATLDVAHVLEGSFRKDCGKTRITAQLINARDGYQLWSETYDELLEDMFALQDKVANEIVRALATVMDFSAPDQVSFRATGDEQAYALYVQGRQLTYQANGQTTIPTAIGLLERAVQLDPGFASAWSWLALAKTVLGEYAQTVDWRRHYQQAREAIQTSLELDPSNAETWHTKGTILTRELKIDEAYEAFEKAYRLDPNSQRPLIGYGYANSALGHYEKAAELMQKAIAIDPLNGIWYGQMGGIELQRGDKRSAEKYMQQAYDFGFGPAVFTAALLIGEREGSKAAIDYVEDCYQGFNASEKAELQSPLARKLAFNAFYKGGRLATWLVSSKLKRRYEDPESQPTISSIMGFYFMRQPENLMRAILQKPNSLPGYVIGRFFEKTERGLELRSHPDFPDFAERIGLVRAWQKYGWPETVQPLPGTDGSNLQFAVN